MPIDMSHFMSHNGFLKSSFETEICVERQLDGIRKAKERGVKFDKRKKSPLGKSPNFKADENRGNASKR